MPKTQHQLPEILEQRIALTHAIAVIGKLLPVGMEVRFFREEGEANTTVESRFSDGEVTRHQFTELIN